MIWTARRVLQWRESKYFISEPQILQNTHTTFNPISSLNMIKYLFSLEEYFLLNL